MGQVEGTYYIQNRNSGLYLSLENSSTKDGASIRQYDLYGLPWMQQAAQWNVRRSYPGYILTNVHSGNALNVKDNADDEGATLIQSDLLESAKACGSLTRPKLG